MGFESIFEALPGLAAYWSEIAAIEGRLYEQERHAVANAVTKRAAEFAAGRELARHALRSIGVEPVAIPVGERRMPVWPRGALGSISHSGSRVAVAVGRRENYRAIGLDLERERSVAGHLVDRIMTDGEQARYASTGTDPADIFSCKEAVYKSVNPEFAEFLDFHDVEVDIKDDRFVANCNPAKASAVWIAEGRGTIHRIDGYVATVFAIAAVAGR